MYVKTPSVYTCSQIADQKAGGVCGDGPVCAVPGLFFVHGARRHLHACFPRDATLEIDVWHRDKAGKLIEAGEWAIKSSTPEKEAASERERARARAGRGVQERLVIFIFAAQQPIVL